MHGPPSSLDRLAPRRAGRRRCALVLPLALVLAACNTEPVQPQYAADPVDMRGNWELDYGSSDNLQAQFNTMVRELRDRQARASAAQERGVVVGSGGSASRDALLGLAQMAELVTQTQLLDIEQDRVSIRVQREGTFTLSCDYGSAATPQRQDFGVGSERCFWDGRQLVFEIRLPEGLDIVHRFSVASSGEALAVVTTLYSSSVSTPFSLRRIYRRFDPGRRRLAA